MKCFFMWLTDGFVMHRCQNEGGHGDGNLYCEEHAAQQSVQPTNAPVLNYTYVKGVGHYKDCCVCVGECICG